MRRPPPARFSCSTALLVLLGAICLACGGGDVEISNITTTPTASATAEATSTPTPPPASIPAAPENLFAGGLLVSDYLAAGGSGREDCLPSIVAKWDLAPVEGERCVTVPLELDAEDFVFVVRLDSGDPEVPSPGDAWFFGEAENFRLVATARQLVNALTWDLSILAVADLTGDGLDELVMRWSDCEVEPCAVHLLVASAHRGRLQDIGPDGLAFATLDGLEVRDDDDDGLLDLVLTGATDLPSVEGALTGPQRGGTTTLSWGGIRFFASEELDPPTYLIQALQDADRLFASGNYANARLAYEAAARDPALLDWHAENGQAPDRVNLLPYAWFRAGLAAVRSGDGVGGQQLFATAVQGNEGSLVGLAAATYLGGLNGGVGPDQACSLAETVIQTRLDEWARIWDFGTANAPHSVFDFCR